MDYIVSYAGLEIEALELEAGEWTIACGQLIFGRMSRDPGENDSSRAELVNMVDEIVPVPYYSLTLSDSGAETLYEFFRLESMSGGAITALPDMSIPVLLKQLASIRFASIWYDPDTGDALAVQITEFARKRVGQIIAKNTFDSSNN